MIRHVPVARFATALPLLLCLSPPVAAHEAWLLTPSEIEALSRAPIPELFRSQLWLGLAAAIGFALTLVALRIESMIAGIEDRVFVPMWKRYGDISPLVLRCGLAVMMLLGASGGLPRHGIAPWTTPTFLVPDMQLTGAAGGELLIGVQVTLALLLLAGLATRACGVAMVAMAGAGLAVFGPVFWSYAPHFAGPGLILIALGAGRFSCDHVLNLDVGERWVAPYRQLVWRGVQVVIGAGFVYLGLAYKLTQPTLLIAILEHGNMPTFGLPMPVIALAMAGVEILSGALLVSGRLVRPVAVAILGAITFLAVVLGETPLFHANLYGALFVLLLVGRRVPIAHRPVQIRCFGAV